MYRSSVAAMILVFLLASTSVPASAQRNPNAASSALKLLGTFAATVATGAATKVSADYLASWMKRALPQPSSTTPSELRSREVGYQFTLRWSDPRVATVTYTGVLTMLGTTGMFRVTVSDNGRRTAVVEQNMSARPAINRGSDVELFATSAIITERASADFQYFADKFWLTQLRSGIWTIEDTCDGNACAPVIATGARLLAD
jgi:hypothetical protein